MIIPPYLRTGDTIGITCPSGYVPEERVQYAALLLETHGYHVQKGKTVGSAFHYFSGTDEQRRNDLQEMLDDPGIKAILMGRGGYGLSRIIDDLDFTGFCKHPKWICGFSDITVLHSHIQARWGIATLHSVMCGAFKPETAERFYIRSFFECLKGTPPDYTYAGHPFNRTGAAEGILVGGNLAMLAHLTGSISQVDTTNKILFLEDIGEHLYNIDRMLINLKRSGQLCHIKGLVLGSFTDLQDTERPFGQETEEIIASKVAAFDFPVSFGLPCGHQEENVSLQLGMPYRLTAGKTESSLISLNKNVS